VSSERSKWGWANPEFASEIGDKVREVVNRLDPIGLLALNSPPDEYEPEMRSIVAKLVRYRSAPSVEELQSLLHTTFAEMFDPTMAGQATKYRDAAAAIAALWEED